MSKSTQRYDESFTIPTDATHQDVLDAFHNAVMAIEDSGADIDWANLEISSEQESVETRRLSDMFSTLEEWTQVTLTVRGRK